MPLEAAGDAAPSATTVHVSVSAATTLVRTPNAMYTGGGNTVVHSPNSTYVGGVAAGNAGNIVAHSPNSMYIGSVAAVYSIPREDGSSMLFAAPANEAARLPFVAVTSADGGGYLDVVGIDDTAEMARAATENGNTEA